ncbi:uncharacterized protein [Danio rerio]|uniref:UMOD/GP2/OIT3-like D8C domain-containing protein n=1 Tax=Danio rerio TaxID=7955 RepID=A0AB32TKI1_DANRE
MTVAYQNITSDPCNNYQSLDRPWRGNNESGDDICDGGFSWNGWYRLFYYGMDIQIPETCVLSDRCNTYITLTLNGPHPQIEDGVVIRQVCGAAYNTRCCVYKPKPIRVKACPGNYYVYELVNPDGWCAGYCTNVSSISQPTTTISPVVTTVSSNNQNYDPCTNYKTINDNWRNVIGYGHTNGLNADYDDTHGNWDGWYRLYLNGLSAQMPEWCVSDMACGGFSSLWLGGPHPQVADGVVTRDIYGSHFRQCSYYRSDPIQVKACPGKYYVYKFTKPRLSIPAPVYCAVRFTAPSVDPCNKYKILNDTWRATNVSHDWNVRNCDNFQGWYRLFYNGQSAQMSESCVSQCGTLFPMWLNGSHPQLEDGVVMRHICASRTNDCCYFKSIPIQVKACPGNYYVYEFANQIFCGAYCVGGYSLIYIPVIYLSVSQSIIFKPFSSMSDITRLDAARFTTATTPRTSTTAITTATTPRTSTTAITTATTPRTSTAITPLNTTGIVFLY